MGWFDDQIKERIQNDDEVFAEAVRDMAGAVLGRSFLQALKDDDELARDAIEEILKFYHVKSREIPAGNKNADEQLDFLLRPYGIMRRTVVLDKGWYRNAVGAMLCRDKEGRLTALVPAGMSGYSYIDRSTGKRVRVGRKNEGSFEKEAITFYKPFPMRPIGIKDLFVYIFETFSAGDLALVLVTTLTVTAVAMIMPKLSSLLFGEVVAEGSLRLLLSIVLAMACVSLSSLMFGAVNSLASERMRTKMNTAVEAATMMRILSLPTDFFRKYSSGELSKYSANIGTLCDMLMSSILSTGITSLFSLAYLTQITSFAPALLIPSIVIILSTVVITVLTTLIGIGVSKKRMTLTAKESGLSYSLISGIKKIRLAGAEKRAFAKWGKTYAESAAINYNPPFFVKLGGLIPSAISLVGTIVLYYGAIKSGVSASDYYAFLTAYGMVSGAFSSLAGMATQLSTIKPVLDLAKPILDASPEVNEGREVLERISGGIEFSNVSFRYNDDMPNVVDDMSFKIKAGQYIAIVGKTGCGKSTIVRLLLGFEKPDKGAIYYDGKDISKIDLKSLRRKIGVVMQDGKLFSGDIFSNITISAPELTLDEAWEVAEKAGIAEDIRQMPMGMNTILSEGAGGISGGQRQRILIARAIAPKPKLLIFDEATSALDNITQKMVSESLDALKCTRIVIAHRLSTIKHCDRILVLDKGRIIEDGTYDELIERNGFFAELVERQRLDK